MSAWIEALQGMTRAAHEAEGSSTAEELIRAVKAITKDTDEQLNIFSWYFYDIGYTQAQADAIEKMQN